MDHREIEGNATERLAWLVQMCRLGPLAIELFALVAGVAEAPDVPAAWWTLAAAATRLGVDELELRRQLMVGAPLIDWGLVRTAPPPPRTHAGGEARVAVNERIARFLWSRRMRPAEFRPAS
jgi:hypothetical protein